jgi:hypothetical protein
MEAKVSVLSVGFRHLYHTTALNDGSDEWKSYLTCLDNPPPWTVNLSVGEFSEDLKHEKFFTIHPAHHYCDERFPMVLLQYTVMKTLRLIDMRHAGASYVDFCALIKELGEDGCLLSGVDGTEVYLPRPYEKIHPNYIQLPTFTSPPLYGVNSKKFHDFFRETDQDLVQKLIHQPISPPPEPPQPPIAKIKWHRKTIMLTI